MSSYRIILMVFLALAWPTLPLPAQQPADPDKPKVLMPDKEQAKAAEYDRLVRYPVKKGEEVEVQDLLTQIGHQINKLIILDKTIRMNEKILFLTTTELNYSMLWHILELNNIELLHTDIDGTEVIKAYEQRNFQQREIGTSTPVYGPDDEIPDTNALVTQFYHLTFADPNNVYASLRQIITRSRGRVGDVMVVRGTNVLILRDLATNIRYYSQLIKAFDVPLEEQKVEVIEIKYAAVQDMAQLATGLYAGLQQTQQPGVSGTVIQPKFVPDPRTGQLVIIALKNMMEEIKDFIARLDIEVKTRQGNIHIIQLKNTAAKDLGTKLNELMQNAQQARQAAGAAAAAAGNPATREIQTRIVAEDQTNSLLVQAEQKDYEEVLRLVDQLDRRRPQVLIESQIFGVSSTDNFGISLDVAGLSDPSDKSLRGGGLFKGSGIFDSIAGTLGGAGSTNKLNSTLLAAGAPTGLTAVAYKGKAFDKIPLIINMLKANSNTNTLAEPYALTNDNKKAVFTSKEESPIVSQQAGGTGAAAANLNFSTVAGSTSAETTLEITPHISAGGYLRLEMSLTIEDFTAPPDPRLQGGRPKVSRKYTGEVTVPDNRYLVIGGIVGNRKQESISKVPLLGDIPLLGWFFKSQKFETLDTRIFIFIRPHILSDEEFRDSDAVTRYWKQHAREASGRELRPAYGRGLDERSLRARLNDVFGGIDGPDPFK